jgi:hypothetical protein
MSEKTNRQRIELPGDWQKHDRHLHALAEKTGFKTVNRLLRHVANELAALRTPAEFYRACATLHGDTLNPKRKKRD